MCKENLKENEGFVCVYGIRCKETNRIYIGSTCNLEKRLKDHFRVLKGGFKKITSHKHKPNRNHPFQTDFNDFGMESFEVFILEQDIPKYMRDEREEYWIDKYHSTDAKYGYNLYRHCNNSRICRETKFPIPIYIGLPPIPEVW
jgi:group I intron endonuclease